MPSNAAESFENGGQADALFEDLAHGTGGVDMNQRAFAQGEKPEGVVKIGIGEQDAVDGGIARRLRTGV